MIGFNLFFLQKGDDTWTFKSKMRKEDLSVEPKVFLIGNSFLGLAFIAASLAGLVFGVPLAENPQDGTALFIMFGAIGVICIVVVLSAWWRSNWPVEALFDLRQRRVSLTIRRPWHEVSQAYSFSEIRSLYSVRRTEGVVFFKMSYSVGYLEPWNAKRICLGLELEDSYERMGKYLDEIRAVTGIAPE